MTDFLIYNTDTGAYYQSELEAIAAHPMSGVPIPFCLHDHCVWCVPTPAPAHDVLVQRARLVAAEEVDGAWYQRWEVVELSAEEVDARAAVVASLREVARGRVAVWRDLQEEEAILFEHAGRAWDGGLAVRRRLQPLLSLPAVPEGFFWTDADNNDVPVSLEDLQALNMAHEGAIISRGFDIHLRQRAMKTEIDCLEDEAALEAYVPRWV